MMIWATARARFCCRSPGERMRTHTHAHKWDGQQSISAAKSLAAPSATLGAALSPSIHPVDDVAVKLVGREKDLREGNEQDRPTHE